jgi:hypothetical protein
MSQNRLIKDERGLETVEWLAFGAVLLTIISVAYAVLTGNATLRNGIKTATTFYAVNFGKDIGGNAPRVTCLEDLEDQWQERCPTAPDPVPVAPPNFAPAELAAHTQAPVLFDPNTYTLAIFDPVQGKQLEIRPAQHVVVTVEPGTQQVRLFDPVRQQVALFDPLRREAFLVDPATSVLTPASLAELQLQGLIEVFVVEPVQGPSFALLTLGVPGWFSGGGGEQ